MNLAELYLESLERTPDSPYLVVDEDVLTFAALHEGVVSYAKALRGLGVAPGDRVALYMDNRPEIAPLYFACFRIGAVAMPISCFDTAHEAAYSINDCDARVLIAEPQLAERIPAIRAQAPGLRHCYVVGGDPGGNAPSWSDYAASLEADDTPPVQRDDREPAAILYTSGSTGRPKGVTHTAHSLLHCALNRIAAFRHDESHSFLILSKLCHGAGLTSQLIPFAKCGGTVITSRESSARKMHEMMGRWRPTIVGSSPGQLRQALDDPTFERGLYEELLALYVGGDKAPADLYDLVLEKTGVELREAFGMTESGGFLNTSPYEKPKPGSAGLPIPGTELRIVDEEGNELPQGKEGQLIVRTEAMMAGYWRQPEITARTIRDGWLWTGDLARKDEDGFFYLTGRIKDVIVRNTGNVTPAEVEEAMVEHPDVRQCGVFGMPDGLAGEAVWAVIVPNDPAAPPSVESLEAFARERLAERKVPRRWLFMDNLPLTASLGKVDRAALKRMASQELGEA